MIFLKDPDPSDNVCNVARLVRFVNNLLFGEDRSLLVQKYVYCLENISVHGCTMRFMFVQNALTSLTVNITC